MIRISLIILISLSMLSCSTTQKNTEDGEARQRYWPALPETPRYEYLTSVYSSDDIIKKSDEVKMREYLVGKAKPQYILKRPLDMVASNGMLYLLDADSPAVNVFDLTRRRYFKFGYRFEGILSNPVAITVDDKGMVYVADRGRNSILVYDAIGLYQSTFEMNGIATQLAGLAVDSAGFIYAVDRGGIDSNIHQVIKLNAQGELVKRIGTRGKQPGEFNLPTDIAISSDDGTLYVLDTGNFRVQALDKEGQPLFAWGKVGSALGHFGLPRSIILDQQDNVYVSDAQFGNVQVFNAEGKLLLPLGKLSQRDLPGQFSLITGIAYDQKDHLYVLDQYLNKMEIFKQLSPSEQLKLTGKVSE